MASCGIGEKAWRSEKRMYNGVARKTSAYQAKATYQRMTGAASKTGENNNRQLCGGSMACVYSV